MYIQEARKIVVKSVLWTNMAEEGGGGYAPEQLDRAIQFACNFLANESRCTLITNTVTLSGSTAAVDLSSDTNFNGFMPGMATGYRIGYSDMDATDFEHIRRKLAFDTVEAQPTLIGWETLNTGFVYPVPDTSYTLTIGWHPPFTEFEAGTTASILLNIPDRLLMPALWYGAGTALVYGEPVTESNWASTGWQRFLEYVEKVKTYTGVYTPPEVVMNQSLPLTLVGPEKRARS